MIKALEVATIIQRIVAHVNPEFKEHVQGDLDRLVEIYSQKSRKGNNGK